jgi:hypothetical protein
LDTQGSELDILQGSEHLLRTSILGLQVEVEFFPIYRDQPLFADVDNYLRPMGFRPFDLSRYRLRRTYLKTRGQLIWGHAFYLNDVRQMRGRNPTQYLALAAIASFYGFEDYALEVLKSLINKESDLEPNAYKEKIQNIITFYSKRLSRQNQRGFRRLWRKASTWQVTSRKDYGYLIKD